MPTSPDDAPAIDPLLADGGPGAASAAASASSHRRLAIHGRRWWRAIALVVVLVGVLAGLDWVLGHRGRVAPNVELAGEPVGGLARSDLDGAVAELAQDFAATPVTVRSEIGVVTTTAGDLGVAIDADASARRAWDANRSDVPLVGWAVMRTKSVEVPAVLTADAWQGERVLGTGPVAADAQLALRDGALVAVGGTPSLGIDPADVRSRLEAVPWSGDPIELTVPAATAEPARTAADVQSVADRVNAATQVPITVTAGGATATIEPETARAWVRLAPGPEGFTLDVESVAEDLSARFADRASEAVDAHFVVQDGRPVVAEGTPGVSCCGADAVPPLVQALAAGAPPAAPVAVPVEVDEPDVTAADLQALGVSQPVGTFTTTFRCCEARVTNIRRMADILNGELIAPGERLSINELVGPRTLEKGFVEAPAIVEGKIDKELGGGISQVMTTLFNATFFAGLEFGEYQSHSLYFDRYPYGREATVNWPSPDLQIRNQTPHGVVIVTSVSDTSIKVTLWSTPVYASVEQTGQTKGIAGKSCTLVTTERTRVGLDGQRDVDTVQAVYRREPGLDCDQTELPPSTVPTTTTTVAPTTTAPAQDVEPAAPATG